jgi:hypothetical protein
MTEPVSFPVDPVHVMLFARAVCDDNPTFYPAPSPGAGVPPTFTEALQQFIPRYRWRPQRDVEWVGNARPTGAHDGPIVLHAEQRFVYHRPMRVGEMLTAHRRPGGSWQKQSRGKGTLLFREFVTEFRDEAGQLVVTSTAVEVEMPGKR